MGQRRDVRVVTGIVAFALLLVAGLGRAPEVSAQLNVTGQWSTLPYLAPVNPIHVALLPTGKVLIVAGTENDPAVVQNKFAIWNPAAGTFSQGTTPWDLFCNGMSFLPDGRVFLTGGNLSYETATTPFTGLNITTIFDPLTEKFIQVEDMAAGRWYPTNVALGDGGQLTFSGLDEQGVMNKTTEIYDVGGGWSGPYPAPSWSVKWYPRMHLLANGKVVMVGPDPQTRVFDPATGQWAASVSATTTYPESRVYGSSVLLPLKPDDGYAGRILIFGGNTAGATPTVELLDTSVFPEQWISMPPMSAARTTMNAVLLPNGKILALGGSAQFNVASTAALDAEAFDPVAKTWTPSGKMAHERMYHSSALLLPDATVWVAGSNPAQGTWTPQMEIYKPPYLFTSTGALAPRPTISSMPATVGYGQTFTISTPSAASIKDVILMRPGSNTHAFDMEQRAVHATFTKGTGTLTVTAPSSPNAAPPGYYMVFLVNTSGVPSVAKFLKVSPHPTNQAPTASITAPSTSSVSIAAGQSVTFAGTATDPDGSVALYAWNFPGGAPTKSNSQNPGAVQFATPGTYVVSLTVLDNVGANNVSPPTVTVNVTGAPALTAAVTSPAHGATVSGTVTVGMSAGNAQGSPTQFVLKLNNATTLSTQTVSSGSTATYAWNTAGVPNGTHTLNVTVSDGAGRTATASVTVSVNNGGTSPPPGGPTVSITTPFEGDWIGNSVNVKATATGSAPLSSLKFYANGKVFSTVTCSTTSCTGDVWWITGSLPAAKYQIQAVATDTQGGCTVSSAVGVNKDATSPVVASGATCGTATLPPLGASITAPASGATVSGSVTVSMAASNAQGSPTQFVLKLDNGATLSSQSVSSGSTAGYTWNTTTTTNGTHTLNLTVTDGAGRTATAAVTVTVSNTTTLPPLGASITAPANGASVSGSAVTVNMAVSNAQGSPTQFVLKLDNGATLSSQSVSSGSTASYTWNTTATTNDTHTLTLTVTDGAGRTATAAVTVTVSNTTTTPPPGPTVSITTPFEGNWIGNSVNVKATATGGSPISTLKFWGNGAAFATVNCGGTNCNGDVWWITGSLPPAKYQIQVVATDSAGGCTVSTAVGVNKDATSPVVPSGASCGGTPPPPAPLTASITSPAGGATVSGTVTVAMSAGNVQGSPTQFVLKLNNATTLSTQSVSGSSASYAWNTTTVANGSHTLNLTVTDGAGRTASATVSVTVSNPTGPPPGGGDTTAPTVTITSPPNGAWTGNSIDIHVSATDNVGLANITVYGNGSLVDTVACSGPTCSGVVWWITGSLPSGQHTLTATATDTAGNTKTSSPVTINK